MDNFNKIVSFVLGLIVIVVFIAVITGRFNLKNKVPFLSGRITPTPSAAPTPTGIVPTRIIVPTGMGNYNQNSNFTSSPSQIPSTGAPTILLPLLFSGLAAGSYLRKKS